MIIEWQANLFMILYFRDNLPLLIPYLQREYTERGFYWMQRSLQFMNNFYDNRSMYSSINEFYARIPGFINYIADDFIIVKNEYENRKPYVINVYPANHSNIADLQNLSEIVVTFSTPMATDCFATKYIEDSTITPMPYDVNGLYWKDDYSFVIPIQKDTPLEKDHLFGIELGSDLFVSKTGYSMQDDYRITFNTSK